MAFLKIDDRESPRPASIAEGQFRALTNATLTAAQAKGAAGEGEATDHQFRMVGRRVPVGHQFPPPRRPGGRSNASPTIAR